MHTLNTPWSTKADDSMSIAFVSHDYVFKRNFSIPRGGESYCLFCAVLLNLILSSSGLSLMNGMTAINLIFSSSFQ